MGKALPGRSIWPWPDQNSGSVSRDRPLTLRCLVFSFRLTLCLLPTNLLKKMSEPVNPPNPNNQSKEVNLQQMAEQFMIGVQRHLDMLAFSLGSRDAVTEEAYNAYAAATKVMPAPQLHRNFEQMQAYARDLLYCQVVNDSLNISVSCLNNVHFFLTLVQANKDFGTLSPDAQKQSQKKQQEFMPLPLDQKFNRLEEEYGVICELEDSVVSLGFAMQALVQQGGIVNKPQLGEDGSFEIELKVAKAEAEPGNMWRQPNVMETFSKTFKEGDKITFTEAELQSILLTIAVFGHQLFTSVSNYARDNQPGAGA